MRPLHESGEPYLLLIIPHFFKPSATLTFFFLLFHVYLRWKYNTSKRRQKNATLNIEVAEFHSHRIPCQICGGSETTNDETQDKAIDEAPVEKLHDIAEFAKQLGLFVIVCEDDVKVSRVSDDATVVLCSICIKCDLSSCLRVQLKEVKHEGLTDTVESIKNILKLMASGTICAGIHGFKDVVDVRRRSGEQFVAFLGKHGEVVASEEDHNIVRATGCEGLIAGQGSICSTCSNYRSSLRKMRNRQKDRKEVNTASSFVCR